MRYTLKIDLFLILLGLSLYSSGQQPKVSGSNFSLLDSTNLWSILDTFDAVHIHPNDPYSYTKSAWYKIGADTTINSISYKKLMKAMDLSHEKWSISGHLRQEANRVYSLEGTREILLYDFNLTIGGSMQSELYPGQYFTSKLDSVRNTTLNNEIRKIYYLTEFPTSYPGYKVTEIWIEGIGSVSDGLLRKTMLGLTANNYNDYQLLCFHQNETLKYQAKNFLNCYYNVTVGSSELPIITDKFRIFINPGSGKLMVIRLSAVPNSYFEIININGLIIKSFCNEGDGQIVIDLADQMKGIYFLRLVKPDGMVTRKFILN
jgi:hypothetical protein